ncbi:MAG TPA: aminotransferase class IV [Gemmataceae bacterium]|nr:aminotransferase class IV [Gemmataceae bacterium]
MPEPLVYLDGRMVPASRAALPLYDAGLVQGATVTEQTRTFHRRPYRLAARLDRLFRSLRTAGLDPGLSRDHLAAVSEELVAHNAALLGEGQELGLIQFVTAGEYAAYAGRPVRPGPTVCVHTFPLPFAMWAKRMREGAHLVTPSVRQVPPQCWPPHMKCRSRMHYFLAEQEARRVDPEASALLLDLQGRVTETNAANLLIVEGGRIVSPPAEAILPGHSRAVIIELAARLGIPFEERDLTAADVAAAREAFLTSTPFCVMPVTRINNRPVGGGNVGKMHRELLRAWGDEVGLDIAQQIEDGARRSLFP